MKRLILVALCSLIFPNADTIAQCFGGRSSGIRGRIQQRQFERNISNAIRTQSALNSLAFAQSFVAPQIIQQRFVVPQIQSFVLPQVSYVAPSYVQSAPQYVPQSAPQSAPQYVPQSAPQAAPESDIPRVTEQLRQLQEMSQALRALQTE